ncbi:MAG: hypothetical protein M3Z05_08870 [Gemmatimonadota bacterium]|nr:hypothetical protein [Gemmatimonadota bacterium]
MGSAVAVLLIKERHIVEAMERIGAISPATARGLDDLQALGVDDRGMPWHALKSRVVVRQASEGLYYLDMEVWQAARRRRVRVLLLVVAVVVVAGLIRWMSASGQ